MPSGVPPLVQVVGSAPGPNTVKVIVRGGVGARRPGHASKRRPTRRWPCRRCPWPGRSAVKVGLAAATTVSLMAVVQAEAAALLLASPAEEAYHQ